MIVTKPTDNTAADDSKDQAGSASYLLERIRLAELVRELSDRKSRCKSNTPRDMYRLVLEYDRELQNFQETLPPSFTSNTIYNSEMPVSPDLELPKLVLQRVSIQCWIYFQRCMVHLPYFSQSGVELNYELSRRTCLSCSENIVHSLRELRDKHHPSIGILLKANVLLTRSLALAATVFLVDICPRVDGDFRNRETPGMVDAWQLMNEFQEHFDVLRRFLHFSTEMLGKYGITNPSLVNKVHRNTSHAEQDAVHNNGLNAEIGIQQVLFAAPDDLFYC